MDDETIRRLVLSRISEEEEQVSSEHNTADIITSEEVRTALRGQELHDANLYVRLCKSVIRYNSYEKRWYHYNGNNWVADSDDGIVFREIDRLVDCYESELKNYLSQPENARSTEVERIYRRKIASLQNRNRRMNLLKFVQSGSNSFASDVLFDSNPYLLGVRNGIVNLKTGELQPGKSSDNVSLICPHKFNSIDEEPKKWTEFLFEIIGGNTAVYKSFQRVLGYAISGLSNHHQFVVLTGRGRNGKGTLFETLLYVLGDYMKPVPSELLIASNRSKGASEASPEILMLRGVRLGLASETDENDKFSTAKVKWLSGGDTLTGRPLYSKENIAFKPTHTLFLITNNKPRAPADDFAFWERILLYDLELSFVDHPPRNKFERRQDPDLIYKLREEAPAILAWLVRGFLEWKRVGFDPPEKVRGDIETWRRSEDVLQDFLDEYCYEDPGVKIQSLKIYEKFREWAEEQGWKKPWTQKTFGLRMAKKFEREISNVVYYVGITLKHDDFIVG